MKTEKKLLVSLIAILAISVFATFASALAVTIDQVQLNGVVANGEVIAGFSGDSLPVKVFFTSNEDVEDAKVTAWISGYRDELEDSTQRTHLLNGSSYIESLSLKLPADIDLSEDYTLYVRVESKTGNVEKSYHIRMQRESYNAELIDVQSSNTAKAGYKYPITFVLKNTGYEKLEDLIAEVHIVGTDIKSRAYLSDLLSVDGNDGKEADTMEKVLDLDVPSSIATGEYSLEIKVINADFETSIKKNVLISGVEKMTRVLVSETAQETEAGEEAEWTVTLINLGSDTKVYELIPETNEGLSVEANPKVVVVSGGDSKSVTVKATAEKAGIYNFVVRVVSDGKVVGKAVLSAKVQKGFFDTETTIAVVLAIVFAVLLIVLVVLLTRKPKKAEEFEESYY